MELLMSGGASGLFQHNVSTWIHAEKIPRKQSVVELATKHVYDCYGFVAWTIHYSNGVVGTTPKLVFDLKIVDSDTV